jgi:uncharacterized phage protein gp47/JayE
MAFSRPTLAELVARVEADFVSRLNVTSPLLRKSMIKVLSRVVAGAAHLLHGHISWVAEQVLPDTMSEAYLIRFASHFGLSRNEASFATGDMDATGVNGSVIPAGSVVVRDDGIEYTVDSDATIAAGVASVSVTCQTAGEDGNAAAGVTMNFASPISGVDSSIDVDSNSIDGGSDEETIEDFLVRVLAHMSDPPHGGTSADYVAWAKEVSGVTRAFVFPLESGPGTVAVRFVRDDDAGSIIPSAGEVTTVQNYIDTKSPVTATVTVSAPTGVTMNWTIAITPDTSALRALVETALEDYISENAECGTTIYKTKLDATIANVPGITDHTMTIPAADVSHTNSQIAIPGTITWV